MKSKKEVPMTSRTVRVLDSCDTINDDTIKNKRKELADLHGIPPESLTFEITTYEEPYDDRQYGCIDANFSSPKTKEELKKGLELKTKQTEHDRSEYERLSKLFGPDYAATKK